MSEPRKEVMRFAQAMEDKLSSHDGERGDSWRGMEKAWLLGRMFEEVGEYLKDEDSWELIDAANFLMFVWSIHNR